jgi:acetate kinase
VEILTLNAGSSSQKSRLYRIEDSVEMPGLSPPEPLWEAEIAWREPSGAATLSVRTADGATIEREMGALGRQDAVAALLPTLWSGETRVVAGPEQIAAVGHRVVHGGLEYEESARITPAVRAAIARLSDLAPEHNPAALEGIVAVERVLGPAVPQVAVFDTAFHAHLPQAAAVYPGPYAWFEQGIRRFGFHGISHQYCAERAAELLGRDLSSLRLITCHLGNGCSLDAIAGRRSVETTMGFTPMEGLMMGNRSGSIDPGIIFYLLRQRRASAEALDATLNHDSGLEGISGVGSDMRDVLAARQRGEAHAVLAFDMFVHRLRFYIGALLAVLGGLDALVFTAGIGEHAPEVRAGACEALGFLGLRLDAVRNAQSPADANIAAADSTIPVLVIATQEDWMIARDCWRMLHTG